MAAPTAEDVNKTSAAAAPAGFAPKPGPLEPGTWTAFDSLAVTAKRLVDMLEPFANMARDQIEADRKAAAGKKKG